MAKDGELSIFVALAKCKGLNLQPLSLKSLSLKLSGLLGGAYSGRGQFALIGDMSPRVEEEVREISHLLPCRKFMNVDFKQEPPVAPPYNKYADQVCFPLLIICLHIKEQVHD